MIEVPEAVKEAAKEVVVGVVTKPLFVIIGLSFTTTLTTGFLLGRWYGSRKIRQYNKREDLFPLPPKAKFDWNKLKFWERNRAEQAQTSETVSINEPDEVKD